MAQIPPINRLVTEDFPEQNKWIGKLIQPLNQFMLGAVNALNKGLTFRDNFNAQIREIDVRGSLPFAPVTFQSSVGNPAGLWVIAARDKDTSTNAIISSAITVDWAYRNGTVVIQNVAGLSSIQLADTTNTNAVLTNVTNAQSLIVGQSVTGTGIPDQTVIKSISGSSVTLSATATATNAQRTIIFSGKSYKLTVIAVAG